MPVGIYELAVWSKAPNEFVALIYDKKSVWNVWLYKDSFKRWHGIKKLIHIRIAVSLRQTFGAYRAK